MMLVTAPAGQRRPLHLSAWTDALLSLPWLA
jgi:hypothetical protein